MAVPNLAGSMPIVSAMQAKISNAPITTINLQPVINALFHFIDLIIYVFCTHVVSNEGGIIDFFPHKVDCKKNAFPFFPTHMNR